MGRRGERIEEWNGCVDWVLTVLFLGPRNLFRKSEKSKDPTSWRHRGRLRGREGERGPAFSRHSADLACRPNISTFPPAGARPGELLHKIAHRLFACSSFARHLAGLGWQHLGRFWQVCMTGTLGGPSYQSQMSQIPPNGTRLLRSIHAVDSRILSSCLAGVRVKDVARLGRVAMGTLECPERPSKKNGCNWEIPRLVDAVGPSPLGQAFPTLTAGRVPWIRSPPTRCLVLVGRANPCLLIKVNPPSPAWALLPSTLPRLILKIFAGHLTSKTRVFRTAPALSALLRAP